MRAVLSRLKGLLPLAVSAGLLAWLYTTFLADAPRLELRWGWIVVGIAASLAINYGLGAYKWAAVLRAHGVSMAREALIKVWIGIFSLAIVFPLQTGHLLFARTVQTCGRTTFGLGLRTMVYDKGLNILGTLVLIALGQLLLPDDHPASHPAILVGAAAPVLGYLAFSPSALLPATPSTWERPRALLGDLDLRLGVAGRARLLAFSVAYQATDVLSAVIAALALGGSLDPVVVAGAFPMVVLAAYIPASFQGVGVREAFAVLWLGAANPAEAAALGFLVSVMEYVVPAVFGLPCLRFTLAAVAGAPGEDAPDQTTGLPVPAEDDR